MARIISFDPSDFESYDPEYRYYRDRRAAAEPGAHDPSFHQYPTLYAPEVDHVKRLAVSVAAAHVSPSDSFETRLENRGRTIAGLLAECATVKFFKYHMGYRGDLAFNESYVDGCDGGYDFLLNGVRCDVKYGADAKGIDASIIHDPSRADIYILTVPAPIRPDDRSALAYDVVGFMPASAVPKKRGEVYLTRDCFKSPYLLRQVWPTMFAGARPYAAPRRGWCGASEIVDGALDRLFSAALRAASQEHEAVA